MQRLAFFGGKKKDAICLLSVTWELIWSDCMGQHVTDLPWLMNLWQNKHLHYSVRCSAHWSFVEIALVPWKNEAKVKQTWQCSFGFHFLNSKFFDAVYNFRHNYFQKYGHEIQLMEGAASSWLSTDCRKEQHTLLITVITLAKQVMCWIWMDNICVFARNRNPSWKKVMHKVPKESV